MKNQSSIVNSQLSIVNRVATHFESLYPADSRFGEIEKIFGFIKEGFSCELIGISGVGKSNLLRLLAYNRNVRVKHVSENQKWFHFVYLDLSEVKNRSFLDLEKYLFLELADSLRDRNLLTQHNKLHKIFNEHIGLNDELVLFQGLKEAISYLCIEQELTIIFMFDKLKTYAPFITDQFFGNLKSLRNLAKYRFSCIFSETRKIEETLEPSVFGDFLEFFQDKTIYVPIFDKPSLEFRISYIEKITDKKIEKQTLNGIIRLTAGHGKLTKVCLEEILTRDVIIDSHLHRDDKLKTFLLSQNNVQNVLFFIWQSLTPREQKLIRGQGLGFRDETETEYLENVGLLRDNKITIPIFAEFVKKLAETKQTGSETIVFDQKTNEIKKGKIVLSDNLTSLEFRLLKFLLENPNKTVERTEIINAIWKETASTAGVTDQALDQLIFRLRKKIEDDPNNTAHLQTVKGRGLKFNP